LYVIYRLHLEITSDRAAYLDLDCIICGKVKRRVKVTHPVLKIFNLIKHWSRED